MDHSTVSSPSSSMDTSMHGEYEKVHVLAYLCGHGTRSSNAAPYTAPPRGRGRRRGRGQSQRQAAPGRQTPEVEDHNLPQSLDALLALVRSKVERANGQQAPATQGNNSAADGALPAANTDSAPSPPPPPPPPTHTHTDSAGTVYEDTDLYLVT